MKPDALLKASVDASFVNVSQGLDELERVDCEENLVTFLRRGWKYIDPSSFKGGWHLDAVADHLAAVTSGQIRRLVINIPPRHTKSSLVSVAWPAWTWAQRELSYLSGPHVQFLFSSYSQVLAERDSIKTHRLVSSPWYQRLWGERVKLISDNKRKFETDAGGYRLATSTGGTLTGEGAACIVIDDPHNATEIESQAHREMVTQWWDESLSTRLNDMGLGAFVLLQQRLFEDDLTGHVLSRESGLWTHLCLPLEYESSFHCITGIRGIKWPQGFEDPRTEEGEVLCPERVPASELPALKRRLGTFGCTPAESPVLMSDLSLKPISQLVAGDEVVGFDTDTEGGKARRSLRRAKVLETFSYFAPVVRVTLSSGEVIRCTEDHKWYMGRGGETTPYLRPLYRPAEVGRKLMRVCPAKLPELTREQERTAGWVAGFFDGEGTVSLGVRPNKRPNGGDYKVSTQITFYQTAEKTLHLCEFLEKSLHGLGFEFTHCSPRRPSAKPHWQKRRQYKLVGMNLPLCQRFLYVVQPNKWRDRILDAAYKSKFIKEKETVVSIEPDGEEPVFALKTDTGNYVVWGLASSNSAGQLQQHPEPRGGGILLRDWWKAWPPEVDELFTPAGKPLKSVLYPEMDFILASVDMANTEKEENDFSAMSVWGIFRDKRDMPQVILMEAWEERLPIHEATIKIIELCARRKVDRLLIEAKAAGHSVEQEIRRLVGQAATWTTVLEPVKGDKVARAYACEPTWAAGQVWAPARNIDGEIVFFKWAQRVIDQCASLPKGAYDDLADTATQAINHMRRSGLLLTKDEQSEMLRLRHRPPGNREALYDVLG